VGLSIRSSAVSPSPSMIGGSGVKTVTPKASSGGFMVSSFVLLLFVYVPVFVKVCVCVCVFVYLRYCHTCCFLRWVCAFTYS
jgi:hypothetical protein